MRERVHALEKRLSEAVYAVTGETVAVKLEIPHALEHGDYTTNIALVLAKQLKRNPIELATEITEKIGKLEGIESVVVVKPGFLNIKLSNDILITNMYCLLSGEKKAAKTSKSKTILLEYGQPNPFKQIHIGHLRNLTIGESLARLLEAEGNVVKRLNYEGDVGMHVAKALYGMKMMQEEGLTPIKWGLKIEEVEKKPLEEKVKLLGEAYALGAKAYEEQASSKQAMQGINKKIYEKDASISQLWEKGRAWSLEDFERMYKRLAIHYDKYYFESDVAAFGRQVVLDHLKDGIFEKHDGAVVFRGERYGLHTRVFLTKEDYATYEGKDMALAALKDTDFSYHKSIIMTANEQREYFKVVLAALKEFSQEIAKKTEHICFGFVQLQDGKMSSRTGNVITAQWLLEEAKNQLKAVFSDMEEETLEQVAVGAVKYSMLKFGRESDISFSFKESITLQGNSGPYIQYAYARTRSVLNKSKIQNPKSGISTNFQNQKFETEELLLLRQLIHFEEVVASAAGQFAPNLLCNYLYTLASSYNNFYEKHTIVGSEEEQFRLMLTQVVGKTLKDGLYLLGIAAPERM